MRRLARAAGLTVLCVVVLAAVLAAVGLAYRAYRQHVNRVAMAIRAPNGIDEAMYVKLGGLDQYITIRGTNRDNPVLLYLMGGPGNTIIPRSYALYRPWEQHFTVVQWDQRGAGRTWTKNGADGSGDVSIRRMVGDGIELSEFLAKRLGKRQIVLFGVSWGSLLGIEMVKQRPDLFSFYVGSGQFVSGREGEARQYAALLAAVRARHDTTALAQLERIGPDYYNDQTNLGVERGLLRTYLAAPSSRMLVRNTLRDMLFSPDYSLWEQFVSFDEGTHFALRRLWPEVVATDLRTLGTDFQVPMLFIQGADDWQTPTSLTTEYVATIRAPSKELVLIRNADHFLALVLPDTVLTQIVAHVGGPLSAP